MLPEKDGESIHLARAPTEHFASLSVEKFRILSVRTRKSSDMPPSFLRSDEVVQSEPKGFDQYACHSIARAKDTCLQSVRSNSISRHQSLIRRDDSRKETAELELDEQHIIENRTCTSKEDSHLQSRKKKVIRVLRKMQ